MPDIYIQIRYSVLFCEFKYIFAFKTAIFDPYKNISLLKNAILEFYIINLLKDIKKYSRCENKENRLEGR